MSTYEIPAIIIVTQPEPMGPGWQAMVSGHPECWERHYSEIEALGALVRRIAIENTVSVVTDRDEIERLIATEAILPSENVNDKAKRILANYGWVFVIGSTCLCDYDKKEHALSCGYWPNGVIPEEYKTPNDGR